MKPLDNVTQILKISVIDCCIYAKADDRIPTLLLVDYLDVGGDVAKEQLNYSTSIRLNFLLETFKEKANKEDTNEDDYIVVARACTLYLLGCTLFYDMSGMKVPV